jgi:hypothetical protein
VRERDRGTEGPRRCVLRERVCVCVDRQRPSEARASIAARVAAQLKSELQTALTPHVRVAHWSRGRRR